MQLNSYEFILILLPITLFLYFVFGRKNLFVRKAIICASGLAVFGFAGLKGLVILLASMVMNFIMCEVMLETDFIRKPALIFTIALNVLILIVFKYSDFAIITVNQVFGKEIGLLYLSLPLGISFFTFQQIAYVVELYKGSIEKLDLLDYSAYVLYFPKLIMGPIVDPVSLISDFNNPQNGSLNLDHIVSGIKLFSFGLFKKMVLADTFAKAVAWGTGNRELATSLDMILVMLSYTFEIYFDFSGYIDMASGVSKMMNITLPINFNSPYKALSVRDFWDRWHMSLSNFLTNYIYIPLGGSRKGKSRTYINVLIVFTISGIWHGANWTFILWGVLYGMLCIFDRMIEPLWKKTLKPIKWIITFAVINVMWLLFNSASVGEWLFALKTIVLGGSFTISEGLAACFRGVEMPFLEDILGIGGMSIFGSGFAWMWLFLIGSLFICLLFKNNKQTEEKNGFVYMIPAALAFAWSFLYLGSESVFIYNYF